MPKKLKRKNTREPIRYDPPYEPEELPTSDQRPKYRLVLAYLLDQDEVNKLIEASTAQYVEPIVSTRSSDYETYTEEEVAALLDCTFHPRRSKKKK